MEAKPVTDMKRSAPRGPSTLRRLFLWAGRGVSREDHRLLGEQAARLLANLTYARKRKEFYARCPQCGRIYQIEIDVAEPMRKEGQYIVRPVHCQHCKQHPITTWFTRYPIVRITETKEPKDSKETP